MLGMLSDHFTHRGFAVSSIEQHGFYGWAFEVRTSECRAWCLIQGGDPWLLIIEDRRLLQRLLGIRTSQKLEEILDAVREMLQQDSGFSSICWFTRNEYESGHRSNADSSES